MITLEVFGRDEQMTQVTELLGSSGSARRIRTVSGTKALHTIVTANIEVSSIDYVLASLRSLGVSDDDFTLTQSDEIGRSVHSHGGDSLIWEDLLGRARLNSRIALRYLAFMFVAGVVACYGVVDGNGILIVGAMAVSPDLFTITAIAVGFTGRRRALASRALVTLILGMATAAAAAAIFAFGQDLFGVVPSAFDIDSTILRSLTSVNDETVVVALAAGLAGMLALETRASAAVGVAISVTTIPAAAYLGVAIGLGKTEKIGGAAAVLGTNIVMMILGASVALMIQRRMARRAGT